jgi:hypothetical protein
MKLQIIELNMNMNMNVNINMNMNVIMNVNMNVNVNINVNMNMNNFTFAYKNIVRSDNHVLLPLAEINCAFQNEKEYIILFSLDKNGKFLM